jgi:membrane peptidoglycan carboxypeptidase
MLKDALSSNEDYILKLFKNDVTPDQNFAVGSFTQADFTGYAAKTLTRTNWNAAVTVSNKAESSYGSAAQSWTCGTTGNTIYGYWVDNSQGSPTLLWCERFSVSRVLADGDVLNLTPKFTLNSEN